MAKHLNELIKDLSNLLREFDYITHFGLPDMMKVMEVVVVDVTNERYLCLATRLIEEKANPAPMPSVDWGWGNDDPPSLEGEVNPGDLSNESEQWLTARVFQLIGSPIPKWEHLSAFERIHWMERAVSELEAKENAGTQLNETGEE